MVGGRVADGSDQWEGLEVVLAEEDLEDSAAEDLVAEAPEAAGKELKIHNAKCRIKK